MSGILYFIEGHDGPVTMGDLDAWGIGHAFDRVPHNGECPGPSPSGEPGWLICDSEALRPYVPQYLAAEQKWRKFSGSDVVWAGYYTESPPGPADLARGDLLPGFTVELEDGNRWQVPLVLHAEQQPGKHGVRLPAYLDFDADGEPCRGDVLERYRWLARLCEPFWDAWYAGLTEALQAIDEADGELDESMIRYTIRHDTMIKDGAELLKANYRISWQEVALLSLYRDDRSSCDVLKLACDCLEGELVLLAHASRSQKKSQPEASAAIAG